MLEVVPIFVGIWNLILEFFKGLLKHRIEIEGTGMSAVKGMIKGMSAVEDTDAVEGVSEFKIKGKDADAIEDLSEVEGTGVGIGMVTIKGVGMSAVDVADEVDIEVEGEGKIECSNGSRIIERIG